MPELLHKIAYLDQFAEMQVGAVGLHEFMEPSQNLRACSSKIDLVFPSDSVEFLLRLFFPLALVEGIKCLLEVLEEQRCVRNSRVVQDLKIEFGIGGRDGGHEVTCSKNRN